MTAPVSARPAERHEIPRQADDYTAAAARQRMAFLAAQAGVSPEHVGRYSFDPAVLAGNVENFVGVAQVPIGIAGPLLVDGEHARGEFYVPLATTEGALVASYNRGMKLLHAAGGVRTTVTADVMQRAPAFGFDSAREARAFGEWVAANFAAIKAAAEASTHVGRLHDIEQFPASRFLFLRFNFITGDAAGQNLTGKATLSACTWIRAHYAGIADFYLEANLATDKKSSHVNILRTRGKRVTAEATIPADLALRIMHTTPSQMFRARQVGNLGGLLAGVNNNGNHSANAIAALFTATGQDIANVAEIVAATVLCGEVSLGAALVAGEWVTAHERLGRNRPLRRPVMAQTTADRMSTLDAEFYFAEHDNVPMHIGSVAVFDGPAPAYQDVVRLFEAKLPGMPRYRQVVRTTPGQILRPVWVDDVQFTISHHVRHATILAPGGPDQLRAAAAKLFALRLDRSRPLWEEWFLDGLENGRWAIVSRVHHCVVDGVGGNDLMTLVFDTDPGAAVPAAVSWVPAPPPSLAELAAGDLRDAVTRPLRQLAAAPDLLRRARAEDVLGYGRGLATSALRLAEPSAGFLNGPIGPRRRWTWTTASLDELKQIRAARGGTVNHVVLAAITRAFRDLLAERHELTEGLVVRSAVPVSVRSQDEAGVLTNRVSAVLANLPAGEADPVRRLNLIRREMDDLKHTHQAASAEILTGALGFATPTLLALGTQAFIRIMQPLVQTVTTNVPGPRSPLYVLGRRMTALYPYVPIGNAIRISVAIVSYVDTVSFGVTADHDAIADLGVFVRGIRLGLDELNPDR